MFSTSAFKHICMLPSKDVKWDFINLIVSAGGAKDHCNPRFWYNVYVQFALSRGDAALSAVESSLFDMIVGHLLGLYACNVLQGAGLSMVAQQ